MFGGITKFWTQAVVSTGLIFARHHILIVDLQGTHCNVQIYHSYLLGIHFYTHIYTVSARLTVDIILCLSRATKFRPAELEQGKNNVLQIEMAPQSWWVGKEGVSHRK